MGELTAGQGPVGGDVADTDRREAQDGVPVGDRLLLAAVGATPVSLIGFATFGIVDLRELSLVVLLPALSALATVLALDPVSRPLVARAITAGAIATFLYDLFRWWFLIAGWMDRDPIPHIGTSLGLEPGWLFGYLWRYVGNGGGLALVFFVSGVRGIVGGTAHGLLVCSGLLGVLLVSPHGQQALFPLETVTFVVAIVGHVIYGSALGVLSCRHVVVWDHADPTVDTSAPRRCHAHCERSPHSRSIDGSQPRSRRARS